MGLRAGQQTRNKPRVVSRVGASILVLGLALLACKGGTDAPRAVASGSFSGNYDIAASYTPGGRGAYTGTVSITQQNQYYDVRWMMPGAAPYQGVAVEAGEVLGVGWSTGGTYGVVVYQIAGGELVGTWTTSRSKGKVGTERLKGPMGLDGVYQIVSSTNPGGGAGYKGTAAIHPNGPVYDVRWSVQGQSFSGVGIRSGNLLVVGYGQGTVGSVVLYVKSNGALVGQWASPGLAGLGGEILEKGGA